jgi:hypothetical protein
VNTPPARPAAATGIVLAGARGRLLPASIPLRFFGAAVVFHVLAWVALAAGAVQGAGWHGGLGWPLAALHLVTLGTLMSAAIGASLQLLPVATRQPLRSHRLAAALWWGFTPGVMLLVLGMGLTRPAWLAAGATLLLVALALYGALLAANLRGARGMPGVVLHGRGALAALVLLLASAAALVLGWLGRPLIDRDSARSLHLLAGVFGTLGLLAFGLSAILVPMFALAPVPSLRGQRASGAAALAALAIGAAAALADAQGHASVALRAAALALGAVAVAVHVVQMQRTLAQGMRQDLGRSLWLMRGGWAALAAALALAAVRLAVGADSPDSLVQDRAGRVLLVLLVGGWLTSFLFGVLQRILPFLVAMHCPPGRRAPTPSALTLQAALRVHAAAHAAALALLLAGLSAESPALLGAAAATGAAGALAFAAFYGVLLRRWQRALAPALR